jgi:hypothetical protein
MNMGQWYCSSLHGGMVPQTGSKRIVSLSSRAVHAWSPHLPSKSTHHHAYPGAIQRPQGSGSLIGRLQWKFPTKSLMDWECNNPCFMQRWTRNDLYFVMFTRLFLWNFDFCMNIDDHILYPSIILLEFLYTFYICKWECMVTQYGGSTRDAICFYIWFDQFFYRVLTNP